MNWYFLKYNIEDNRTTGKICYWFMVLNCTILNLGSKLYENVFSSSEPKR